jgi:hypothetical protein
MPGRSCFRGSPCLGSLSPRVGRLVMTSTEASGGRALVVDDELLLTVVSLVWRFAEDMFSPR